MKRMLVKILSVFCSFAILFNVTNMVALAEDGKFVLLNISGYDEEGEESINQDNVFYIKDNILYAPIKVFEDYTMYNYDEKNTAFVRAGQQYKSANSMVDFSYEDSTMDVFYLGYQKETYDLNYYQFADTYFFPLDEMAAYLKASVVYKNSDTISILSSGVSISDALYNYEYLTSCLDYDDLKNDIFAGSEALTKTACVMGYFGETVFSFKLTNLLGDYGDYKKYLDILESAVTNNEPYEQLLNNDNLMADVLGMTGELYNEVYEKATKIYKLSSNSITTMFEDFKSINSFGDDSPFDNFFPDEQLEIDKINSFSKYIDAADMFIDTVDFYHKFYTMNQDNKDAIALFNDSTNEDTRAIALDEMAGLYGNNIVEGTATQMCDEVINELLEKTAGKGAEKLISGANKVKLATSIVNSVFKIFGFDLSDNSGYDVMLANELKQYVNRNLDDDSDKLYTQSDCNNMRLTMILGLLIDIQSYKMGNKFADKYGSKGIYDDEIDLANKRIALFYLAKDSEKYDSVAGVENITEQNKKQIDLMDFENLNSIPSEDATRFLSANYKELELQKRQWNANNTSGFDYDEENFAYCQYDDSGECNIILRNSAGKEKTIAKATSNLLVVNNDSLFYAKDKKIYKCNLNGENKQLFFDPKLENEYFYISHLVPVGNNKLVVTVSIGDSAGGTAFVYILHLNSGKHIELEIKSNDAWNFYTSGDYLYYQESEFDVYINKFYDDKLIKYNLNTDESEYVDINFEDRTLKGVFGNTLYSLKRPDPELMEEDWIESIAVPIYKLDLNTLEESVVDTYQSNEPVHDVLVYDDQVFLTTGTGAGNGFAVRENGELNYDNENILDYDGILGENIGFYKEHIICNCWDGSNGEDYGYQKIYKIE